MAPVLRFVAVAPWSFCSPKLRSPLVLCEGKDKKKTLNGVQWQHSPSRPPLFDAASWMRAGAYLAPALAVLSLLGFACLYLLSAAATSQDDEPHSLAEGRLQRGGQAAHGFGAHLADGTGNGSDARPRVLAFIGVQVCINQALLCPPTSQRSGVECRALCWGGIRYVLPPLLATSCAWPFGLGNHLQSSSRSKMPEQHTASSLPVAFCSLCVLGSREISPGAFRLRTNLHRGVRPVQLCDVAAAPPAEYTDTATAHTTPGP